MTVFLTYKEYGLEIDCAGSTIQKYSCRPEFAPYRLYERGIRKLEFCPEVTKLLKSLIKRKKVNNE